MLCRTERRQIRLSMPGPPDDGLGVEESLCCAPYWLLLTGLDDDD